MHCISKYLQEYYNMLYDDSCALFCSLRSDVQDTFFNGTHQMKAVAAIGMTKADPLAEINWLLWCVHLHTFFPINPQNRYKELFPNTHFYISLYSRFYGWFKINQLSHLNAIAIYRHEPYIIDSHLLYRHRWHRGNHCINY